MRSAFPKLTTVALVLLGGTALVAQGTQTASISGQIQDTKDQFVPGATVRLTSPALQGTRTYVSDETGKFNARLLPPGQYNIEVSKTGYQMVNVQQRVGVDQTFTPRITIASEVGMMVEVVSSSPAVDKTEVKTATNFVMDDVSALPTARNVESLIALTAGVSDSTQSTVNGVQIRGAMSTGNMFLVDGMNVQDNVYGSRGVSLIDDAIQEVQILTGAIPAEYGDVDGGVVNAITREGGNEFSGTLRTELSNNAWDATQPTQHRETILNKLNHRDGLSLGGYFIKDKFWFFISGWQRRTNTASSIGTGAIGENTPYNFGIDEKRFQAKLRYTISQNHSLVFSMESSNQDVTNNDYSAGELAALTPQTNKDSFWSLSWQAVWASDLTMELRTGRKKQILIGGGNPAGPDTIYDQNTYYFYQNGLFNAGDGGDNRNNASYDFKLTRFWNAAGSHETVFGSNYVSSTNRSRNDQAPHSKIFVSYLDAPTTGNVPTSGEGISLQQFFTSNSPATSKSLGIFLNDKWTINKNLLVNLGLRHDHYSATNDQLGTVAGASGWSPRLGMKLDILGDSKWLVNASFCRYNAKPLDNILRSVSNTGNPTSITFSYTGPSGSQPISVITDPSNYQQVIAYSDPLLNVRLASNLKAPTTDEYQLGVAHSFKALGGAGYLSLNAVRKDFKNLIDYRVGNDGTVNPPSAYSDAGAVYVQVWENSDVAKRKYKGLELESNLTTPKWAVGGNITWSRLEGNYQGESLNGPASGQGIKNFLYKDGVQMYDSNMFNPYGPLTGDVPLRIRANGSYNLTWGLGKTSFGLIYRFESGAHDSITRPVDISLIGPGGLPSQANPYGTFTQYWNNQRGNVIYRSSAYTDLAITQDFKLMKVGEKNVNFFAKLIVYNVFNHQQIITWQNIWNGVSSLDPSATGPNDPWKPADGYGKPSSTNNYASARKIDIEAGFRF